MSCILNYKSVAAFGSRFIVFLVTGVFITMAMAVQEEPQRLERVLPISEVVEKLALAEYAMKEYDWRWRCVVDNGIRAIVKWTRLMLSIRVVDLHAMKNKETRC